MNTLILFATLVTAGSPVETGSLIFLQNADKVVDTYTGTEIDHVAMVIQVDGKPWIYEATPPKVRRLALHDYYKEIVELNTNRKAPVRIWLMRPTDSFTKQQSASMKSYLDSQIGRRYSIRGYVRDKEGDGIHCAEFTANMLTRTGKLRFTECYNENPSTLLNKVVPLYETRSEITITTPTTEKSWCDSQWKWWGDFSSWCGWSSYETWTFCR